MRETQESWDEGGYEERPSFLVRFLKSLSFYIIVAAVALLLNFYVIRIGFVNGESMLPTLQDRNIVLIWQLGYTPKSGDIIVTDEDNELGIRLTKRVIATEGQTLVIESGTVYVNGNAVKESYINEADWASPPVSITVPKGQVFVMGDNRNASTDSRELGCIPNDEIMGSVVFRIWPVGRVE